MSWLDIVADMSEGSQSELLVLGSSLSFVFLQKDTVIGSLLFR